MATATEVIALLDRLDFLYRNTCGGITRAELGMSYRDARVECSGIGKQLAIEAARRGLDSVPFDRLGVSGLVDNDSLRIPCQSLRTKIALELERHEPARSLADLTEWSRPMSKKDAAVALGFRGSKKADWINNCVKDGTHRIKSETRQTFRFDMALIPANLHAKFSDNSTEVIPLRQ